jgi:CelD/BcsL family acetyltransferase involved in cellulose biosynthesis
VLERGQSPAALDWLLEQKLAWLDRTGKSAEWLTSGYTRRFLHRALLTPGAQKWSIWTATLDGRPFAATLCLEEPRLWYPIMVTHDPAMDHLSPGRTLNLLLVEQAFAAGVERVEFGITDSQWKDRLAAGHEAVVRQRIRIR